MDQLALIQLLLQIPDDPETLQFVAQQRFEIQGHLTDLKVRLQEVRREMEAVKVSSKADSDSFIHSLADSDSVPLSP